MAVVGRAIDNLTLYLESSDAHAPAVFDLFQATLGPNYAICSSVFQPGGLPQLTQSYAVINSIGYDTNAGVITVGNTDQYSVNVHPVDSWLTIAVTDVVGPTGAVIQPGILTNTGAIYDGADAVLDFEGSSVYSRLQNNGSIGAERSVIFGLAVTGTGTIGVTGSHYTGSSTAEFRASVSAGQTITANGGTVVIDKPADFQGTIASFDQQQGYASLYNKVVLAGIQATTGTFAGGVLTLYNGSTIVDQIKFSGTLDASKFTLTTTAAGTTIGYLDVPFYIPYTPDPNAPVKAVAAPPSTPAAANPPVVAALPGHSASDIVLTTQTRVATTTMLDGYTIRLEGTAAATQPAVAITSVQLGASERVIAGGDTVSAARFGAIQAVGLDQNGGLIEAKTNGAGAAATTLKMTLSDIVSPSGADLMAASFNNTGTIQADAGTTISITGTAGSKLINTGALTATGTMLVGTAVTGTGAITIGAASGAPGALELAKMVATGQTIAFARGTLTLDDVPDFGATITSFNAADTIRLHGLDVTSVSYDNGKLSLGGASGSLGALHFKRPAGAVFDNTTFLVSHVQGDTLIQTHSTAV